MKQISDEVAPSISNETLKAMTEFFLKTSIPRILKEMKEVKTSDLQQGRNGKITQSA